MFLSPLAFLLIARGCDHAIATIPVLRKGKYILPFLLLLGGFSASTQEMIKPDVFGRYKKSYQKEALLYVNENFREGDVVYVYWNMNYAYRYYKKAYQLRYNAIEGSDVKFESVSPSDYIQHLEPDFTKFKGNRRVWVVYNKKLWNDIGEIESKPDWYNHSQPGEFLYRALRSRATEKASKVFPEVNVSLFDFSSAR
ncbi:MAG: hypothetical protein ACO1NU_01380 [Arcticibacter sp.]